MESRHKSEGQGYHWGQRLRAAVVANRGGPFHGRRRPQGLWRTALMGCFTVAVAVAMAPSVASAQEGRGAQTTALDDELAAELDSYLENALAEFEVPGAAVGVIVDGQVAYLRGLGVLGVDDPRPVNTSTRFMIGSVTKSMTATMIATLVDEGRLDWDVPIGELLPGFALSEPEAGAQVTLRHVLSHLSGVPRYDVDLLLEDFGVQGLIEEMSTVGLIGAPGEGWDYNNQIFALGGFAATRAVGTPFRDRAMATAFGRLMHQRLFDALGMPRSTLKFAQAIRGMNHALPHAYDPRVGAVAPVALGFERLVTQIAPAGAAWSTIEDMGRYVAMQINEGVGPEGQQVVSEEALLQTHTAQIALAEGVGYGLGWVVLERPEGTLITHDGGTLGFGCEVVMDPAQDWGIVVLTNSISSFGFVSAVERYASELFLGAPHQGDDDLLAATQADRAATDGVWAMTVPVDAAMAARVAGAYERDIRLVRKHGQLFLQTAFGEVELRGIDGLPGVLFSVDNALFGVALMVAQSESGQLSLEIGLPDPETLELAQSVVVEQVAPAGACSGGSYRAPRHPSRAFPDFARRMPPRWARTPWPGMHRHD